MNKVTDYIKKQGIDSQDIQTSELYVAPKYNYTNGQNSIIGYQATQTVTVKIKKLDASKAVLEKIISEVINYGANSIQGVNFSISDTKKLKESARIDAINNAKDKAKSLAFAANLSLGKIVNVIEAGDDNIYPSPRAMMGLNAAQVKSVAPNIELGSEDITGNITLLFEVYKK